MKTLPILLAFLLFSNQSLSACNIAPAQVQRDDVLVVVNDNSKSSPEIGNYYCEQRGIDPNNVAHVRVPATNDVELDQFVSLRDQLIKHMQENTFPSGITATACDTAQGYTQYYCPESINQLRENSSIRYVVMTKGLPIRFNFSGSTVALEPETSIDNYLRFWLTNYYTKDVIFTINNRSISFDDGRGMREVNPNIDLELIVGRIDGINTESAKQLVDRAINAEKNGIYGKLYGNKFGGIAGINGPEGSAYWKKWLPNGRTEIVYPSWHYLHGLFGEFQSPTDLAIRHTTNPECLNYDTNGRIPKQCVTAVNRGGVSESTPIGDEPLGKPEGKIPSPDNALVHQAYLDGFSTVREFDHLLNWRDTQNCNTLCADAVDVAACRASSTDAYKEIDTSCVRVAEGYMGYAFNSYPVGMMASWPTGWFQSSNSHPNQFDQTGSSTKYYWQPEIRDDTGFDDNFSLWYINSDNTSAAKCYTGDEDYNLLPTGNCKLDKIININNTSDISERTINAASPQKITIKFKYRGINLNNDIILRARLLLRESAYDDGDIIITSSNQVVYSSKAIKTLTAPNDPTDGTSWGNAEISYTLDPSLHKHPQYLFDAIKIRIETNKVFKGEFEGELAFDDFSAEEVFNNNSTAPIPLTNSSFNDGHRQLSGGDSAATFLSRLNGTAFWANLTHHESNGHSFTSHPYETLIYFLRGLPLGDAVWFAEMHNSGIFYGDPLYSPIAIHLHYQSALDDWAADDQFSTIHDSPLVLTGDTLNGTDASASTRYSISYCSGDDFLICDQDGSWANAAGLQDLAGGQRGMTLGSWDISALPDGDYVLRLAVTSTHPDNGAPTSGASQTFYDYYTVNFYAPVEDEDEDGLIYSDEIDAGTNPRNRDTDNDGLSDLFEFENEDLDPLVDNTGLDSDGDGVEDFVETLRGTDLSDAQDTPIISTLIVDPVNGIDDASSPYKTFEAALNDALAGDKISLLSGTYNAVSMDFSVPVDVQGPSDKSAIFPSVGSLRNRTIGTVKISGLTFNSTELTILGDAEDSVNRWKFDNTNFSTNITIKSGVLVTFIKTLFTDASQDAINLLDGSSAVLQNCTLTNNTVGIRANNASNIKITNSIISGNTSIDIVGALPSDLFYSLASNVASLNNATFTGVNGNIGGDPLFVDPLNGDYHLKPESPAIDAGDPQSDFSSEPTSTIGRINLGVYGNTGEATIAGPKDPGGGQQPEQSSSSGQVSWTLILWLSLYGVWRTGRKYQTKD